ncbi:MAG: hypothetical protein AB1772_01510 [Candidatus Zixiibacteriota bacterium]
MQGLFLEINRRWLLKTVLSAVGAAVLLASGTDAQVRTISSLPYTVTTSDNGYTLELASSRMTATGRAITFDAGVHDVTLRLDGDTIVWGTAGTQGTTAIAVSGLTASYNITIHGGTILHSPPPAMEAPDAGLNATAMSIGNRHHDIRVRSTKFTIRGHDSQFIINAGGAYNVEIDSCVFESFRQSFTYRDQWVMSALNVFVGTVPLNTSGLNYTIKWTNNQVLSANWCNLYVEGPTLKALIYGNAFFTDGLNTYTVGTFSTAAQNYCLSMRFGTSAGGVDRSIVNCYNNTFRAGTNYAGGRGIFISSIDGYSLHPDSSIYIHDNDFELHQGWDEEERTLNGIIVRQGWSNIHIRNNRITVIGNANNPSSSYDAGPIACLRLTGSPMGDGLKIVGNTLTSYFIGGVNPNYGTSGPFGAGVIFDAYEMNMPNVTIDSNTFNTDNVAIRWGFYNGNAGASVFRNNTYNYLSGDNGYVFQLYGSGGGSEASYGNIDRDGIFTGGASATDIFVNEGEPDPMDIGIEATLRVTVMGNNSQPVEGAQVTIRNAYGTQVGNLTTPSNGIVNQPVRYWYQANASRGPDSTGYNLFSIKAKRLSDSTTISYSVGANTKSAVITLANTPGGGASADTIPPGRINDLGAVCDSLGQGAILTWTAVGDDGSVGQATRYDLRYSLSPISEGNFGSAGVVSNPPVPKPSGQTESFLVTTLQDNTPYYFAIKAYDDEDLGSDLDEATEYSPINIRAPTADTIVVDQPNRLVTLYATPVRGCQETYLEFQVDSVDTFPSPFTVVDSVYNTSADVVISGLADNTVYYWRCRAISTDGSLAGSFTPTQTMLPFITFASGCDDIEMVYPVDGQSVTDSRPALQIQNVSADPNVYFFELSNDAAFQNVTASGVVYQQAGATTSWTVPLDLSPAAAYYWRVRFNNCENWFSTSFAIASAGTFAFPNPFRPGDGQLLTFSSLAAKSNLVIMTVSGELVRYWQDVGGGKITWDGTNLSGHLVASGVYVWSVEPGDLGGKIIVQR